MKKIVLFLLLVTISKCFGQVTIYKFETIDRRIEEGWQIMPSNGEIYLDDKFIKIVTEEGSYEFKIKTESYWLNDNSFMYGCTDWLDRYVNIRMVVDPNLKLNGDWVDFYLYFDGRVFEYYRLCLTKIIY